MAYLTNPLPLRQQAKRRAFGALVERAAISSHFTIRVPVRLADYATAGKAAQAISRQTFLDILGLIVSGAPRPRTEFTRRISGGLTLTGRSGTPST